MKDSIFFVFCINPCWREKERKRINQGKNRLNVEQGRGPGAAGWTFTQSPYTRGNTTAFYGTWTLDSAGWTQSPYKATLEHSIEHATNAG